MARVVILSASEGDQVHFLRLVQTEGEGSGTGLFLFAAIFQRSE